MQRKKPSETPSLSEAENKEQGQDAETSQYPGSIVLNNEKLKKYIQDKDNKGNKNYIVGALSRDKKNGVGLSNGIFNDLFKELVKGKSASDIWTQQTNLVNISARTMGITSDGEVRAIREDLKKYLERQFVIDVKFRNTDLPKDHQNTNIFNLGDFLNAFDPDVPKGGNFPLSNQEVLSLIVKGINRCNKTDATYRPLYGVKINGTMTLAEDINEKVLPKNETPPEDKQTDANTENNQENKDSNDNQNAPENQVEPKKTKKVTRKKVTKDNTEKAAGEEVEAPVNYDKEFLKKSYGIYDKAPSYDACKAYHDEIDQYATETKDANKIIKLEVGDKYPLAVFDKEVPLYTDSYNRGQYSEKWATAVAPDEARVYIPNDELEPPFIPRYGNITKKGRPGKQVSFRFDRGHYKYLSYIAADENGEFILCNDKSKVARTSLTGQQTKIKTFINPITKKIEKFPDVEISGQEDSERVKDTGDNAENGKKEYDTESSHFNIPTCFEMYKAQGYDVPADKYKLIEFSKKVSVIEIEVDGTGGKCYIGGKAGAKYAALGDDGNIYFYSKFGNCQFLIPRYRPANKNKNPNVHHTYRKLYTSDDPDAHGNYDPPYTLLDWEVWKRDENDRLYKETEDDLTNNELKEIAEKNGYFSWIEKQNNIEKIEDKNNTNDWAEEQNDVEKSNLDKTAQSDAQKELSKQDQEQQSKQDQEQQSKAPEQKEIPQQDKTPQVKKKVQVIQQSTDKVKKTHPKLAKLLPSKQKGKKAKYSQLQSRDEDKKQKIINYLSKNTYSKDIAKVVKRAIIQKINTEDGLNRFGKNEWIEVAKLLTKEDLKAAIKSIIDKRNEPPEPTVAQG
jgi:hypothetical protein